MSLNPAREFAMDCLLAIFFEKKKLSDVLNATLLRHGASMKKVDRNLLTEIVYGTTRWYSKMFWILDNTSTRKLKDVDPKVQIALLVGTYQIFYLDRVPDRAAVNESVEYIKKKGLQAAAPFVNGILRQIARKANYFAKPDKEKQPVEYLAIQHAHPEWIVNKLYAEFGFAKTESYLIANNQQAPFSIRLNSLKLDLDQRAEFQRELLRSEKIKSQNSPLKTCLQLLQFPRLDAESSFGQGNFTLQNEASQIVGMMVDPAAGEQILDACCGPAGKLSHLQELSKEQAKLVAMDRAPAQIKRAKELWKRMRYTTEPTWIQDDALKYDFGDQVFDKILLDAPCSGLGVVRRHPDGKWLKDGGIFAAMQKVQRDLLKRCFDLLKPGGELVYAVCTYERDETSDQIAWFTDNFPVEALGPKERIPDYFNRFVTSENYFHVFPSEEHQLDGFFAVILKKS